MKLSHRERVKRVLSNQEADRIPLDLGSTGATVMTIDALKRLREYFGKYPIRKRLTEDNR